MIKGESVAEGFITGRFDHKKVDYELIISYFKIKKSGL